MPIERGALLDQTEKMAAGGLRILAVAYRDWPELPDGDERDRVESDLTLLALSAFTTRRAPKRKMRYGYASLPA